VTEEILINVTPQETRVAVVQQGVVQEVQVERASARGLVGNICMGRVVRVPARHAVRILDIGGRARPRSCTSPTSGAIAKTAPTPGRSRSCSRKGRT